MSHIKKKITKQANNKERKVRYNINETVTEEVPKCCYQLFTLAKFIQTVFATAENLHSQFEENQAAINGTIYNRSVGCLLFDIIDMGVLR